MLKIGISNHWKKSRPVFSNDWKLRCGKCVALRGAVCVACAGMPDQAEKKENIFLDARLIVQISVRAFRAELSNGHRLVVYARGDVPREPVAGDVVKVCLSPFDMSAGRIVFEDVK